MDVTREMGLGPHRGDSEGLLAGRPAKRRAICSAARGSLAPVRARAGRVPAGGCCCFPWLRSQRTTRNRAALHRHRWFPWEDAVARTPLPCLSLRDDPPMGKVKKRGRERVIHAEDACKIQTSGDRT